MGLLFGNKTSQNKVSQNTAKKDAALKATEFIKNFKGECALGVGTGSTVNYLIDALADSQLKNKIEFAVSSSKASTERLKKIGIPVEDLNTLPRDLDLYIDGADEVTQQGYMIKGGGAALTGEKIVASISHKFICIIDPSKQVDVLGTFPLPIEVIPMARSAVAREIVKLGGQPEYRIGTVTDYGNIILDIHGLNILDPKKLESDLNNIPGVVTNGIFAFQKADEIIIGNID